MHFRRIWRQYCFGYLLANHLTRCTNTSSRQSWRLSYQGRQPSIHIAQNHLVQGVDEIVVLETDTHHSMRARGSKAAVIGFAPLDWEKTLTAPVWVRR